MSDTFDINKFLAEAHERMVMDGNLYVQTSPDGAKVVKIEGEHGPELTVEKISAIMQVPLELLVDYGAMTEEEARARGWEPTVYPPTPWHRRLRYRIWRWRDAAALKLYRLVAGHDPEPDDDY